MRLPAKSKLTPASKARPCPVCGGDHKCSTSPDGLILCGRTAGPAPGFAHLGPAKDPTWHLYREEETLPARRASEGRRWPSLARRAGHDTPTDFRHLADQFARNLTPQLEAELASKLGLPVAALAAVPGLGWDDAAGRWTFPECDAAGHVVGLSTRFRDGTKRSAAGSRRGLFLPAGWADHPGPLFVVEGMSDALALTHVGLAAVGRPGAKAGADLLADLVRRLDPARPVVVLGENDRMPDGTWPGQDGADHIADALSGAVPGRRVMVAMPPEAYKDAREWITDRLADCGNDDPEFPLTVGRDIADAIARLAVAGAETRKAPDAPPPFPIPLPITELTAAGPAGTVPWVWDGYLARGRVTLLAALPKCGKTTLLTHLLKALESGGEFCGRAVVVSEEAPDEWAGRRDALGLTDKVRVLSRPFFGKPSYDDWLAFLTHLLGHLSADPADVVVLDTLADLWPAKDENSATEVHAALQPLRKLADGRAVVLVHHLRKSDGAEGTGSRGSGALAGFVDVIAELRRAGKATDPRGSRRVLKAYGRMTGIPPEWLIELDDGTNTYRHVGTVAGGDPVGVRAAILAVLPAEGDGMTRDEVWAALPGEWQRNGERLSSVLEAENGTLWHKTGRGVKGNPYRYRRVGGWAAKGSD